MAKSFFSVLLSSSSFVGVVTNVSHIFGSHLSSLQLMKHNNQLLKICKATLKLLTYTLKLFI